MTSRGRGDCRLLSELIVIDRGWTSPGGIFSWWEEVIVIALGRMSNLSCVCGDGGKAGDGPKLSVVILVGSVLPWIE